MKIHKLIFTLLCVVLFQVCYAAEPTTVYLTRHGQTHWNAKKLWQGTTDTTLNIDGVQQAAEKAKFFKDMKVEAIYTSPLQRAYLTAQIIAAAHEKLAIPRMGLIEHHLGPLEGMHADNVHALIDSRLNALSQEERRKVGDYEGLMSLERITANAEKELSTLAKKHAGGTIVAVSHSGILKAIIAMHTDAIHESIAMSNMAYVKYIFDGENLTLVETSPDIVYDTYN